MATPQVRIRHLHIIHYQIHHHTNNTIQANPTMEQQLELRTARLEFMIEQLLVQVVQVVVNLPIRKLMLKPAHIHNSAVVTGRRL